jgi:hypothetical protein
MFLFPFPVLPPSHPCLGTNVLTLAPAPVDEVTALERLRGAVVTSNPLSPLFHRRDVVPVFAKPTSASALAPDAMWVPSEEYSIRQGSGVFRKKTTMIAARLAQRPALPLPRPDPKPGAVRTLQPDIAKGTKPWHGMTWRGWVGWGPTVSGVHALLLSSSCRECPP